MLMSYTLVMYLCLLVTV